MDGVTQLWSPGDRAMKEPWQWECGYGVIRREWRWEQVSGNVVMEYSEGSRDGNKAVVMWLCAIRIFIEGHREVLVWLWSNGRSAEKETRHCDCGYVTYGESKGQEYGGDKLC